jgi:hypothetical protein
MTWPNGWRSVPENNDTRLCGDENAVGKPRGQAAAAAPEPNLPEIRRAISLLFAEQDVVEIRALKTRVGTISGYFDDPDLLAKAIYEVDKKYRPAGVYVTLNRLDPQLLGRFCNRIVERAKVATTDPQIIRRMWLPVDLDPVRLSGVSSSDEQHAAAIERARVISADFRNSWGEPILADSGNGAHLLYRIDLPNDEASLHYVKSALIKLDRLYSDDVIKVDGAISNAARIWKAYGTISRKGDKTIKYPHRMSRILAVPGA